MSQEAWAEWQRLLDIQHKAEELLQAARLATSEAAERAKQVEMAEDFDAAVREEAEQGTDIAEEVLLPQPSRRTSPYD